MSECSRFEEILRDRDLAGRDEMAAHVEACVDCAALVRDWAIISEEAGKLVPAPASEEFRSNLLTRVEQELVRIERARRNWTWVGAIAAVLLMTAGMATFWLRLERSPDPLDEWVIRNSALAEVERSEEQYRQSIERLAAIVERTDENESSPRLAALQEKLLLLDQAIAECETEVQDNPYHAELRHQLLTVYRQKDETLRDLLEVKRQ